jgi:hypothetical protein
LENSPFDKSSFLEAFDRKAGDLLETSLAEEDSVMDIRHEVLVFRILVHKQFQLQLKQGKRILLGLYWALFLLGASELCWSKSEVWTRSLRKNFNSRHVTLLKLQKYWVNYQVLVTHVWFSLLGAPNSSTCLQYVPTLLIW